VSRLLRAAGPLTALGLLAACSRQPPAPPPDVVARMGDTELRYAEFEASLRASVGESAGALASEALSKLFDQFLTETALRRLAIDRQLAGADTPPRDAIEALLAAESAAGEPAADIGAYYAAHLADFRRPERVELRQILTEDRRPAERARRELAAGAAFAEVVARLGADVVAPATGEQGALAKDELPAAFADVVFRLADGQVSDVLPAEYGFHVFQVVRHLPAETIPIAAALPEIRSRLAAERADAALARLVAAAKSRYAVEVFDRNLPFNYRGAYPAARPYDAR
jgi:parvulin-like peptidyl-prolyl isomerase